MAIKAGQIVHDINGFTIDRIQSGGPGNLNIPEEKIYELGNDNSVATVRDTPDLSFDLESYDVSCELEALLVGKSLTHIGGASVPTATTGVMGTIGDNDMINFTDHIPIDVVSPFKSRRGGFDIVKGLAVPYLTLERASYRFGIRQNAMQSFTLRGDSIYYTPGTPLYQEGALPAPSGGAYTITLDETATRYSGGASFEIYALCVVLINSVAGTYKRLYFDSSGVGVGYDGTSTSVEIRGYETSGYDSYRITYSTGTDTTPSSIEYDPAVDTNPNGNELHQGVSVKPAAVRPRDIDVYIYPGLTPTPVRLTSVQSAEVNWSANLEQDEEFGNRNYVSMDYDVPDVAGTIGVKPYDPADLWTKLAQITGVDIDEVIGPDSAPPMGVEIRIYHPDDGTSGTPLKTLYVPDARFQVPGMQGRVQTKLETSMPFTSDQGILEVYNGERI